MIPTASDITGLVPASTGADLACDVHRNLAARLAAPVRTRIRQAAIEAEAGRLTRFAIKPSYGAYNRICAVRAELPEVGIVNNLKGPIAVKYLIAIEWLFTDFRARIRAGERPEDML